MKKTATILMVAAVVCLMGACNKEGVYNPKKKIANIYESSEQTYSYYDEYNGQWQEESRTNPKHLTEKWTWDDNLLTEIGYAYEIYENDGSSTTCFETTKFTYNDDDLLIEAYDTYERMTVTYDDRKPSKIEMYYDYDQTTGAAEPSTVATFHYDGKQLSKIDVKIKDKEWKKAKMHRNSLTQMVATTILPDRHSAEKVINYAEKTARKGGDKEYLNFTINLTWDGDNVVKVSGNTPEGTMTIEYTYDNKNNPFQGFLYGLFYETIPSDESGMSFNSKNNVVKTVTRYVGDNDVDVEEFSYTYDGKWPVTITYSKSYSDDYERSSYTMTTYLEYK